MVNFSLIRLEILIKSLIQSIKIFSSNYQILIFNI